MKAYPNEKGSTDALVPVRWVQGALGNVGGCLQDQNDSVLSEMHLYLWQRLFYFRVLSFAFEV